MVGGQENFDRYFQITNGQVVARSGVDISGANAGVQELLGAVEDAYRFISQWISMHLIHRQEWFLRRLIDAVPYSLHTRNHFRLA